MKKIRIAHFGAYGQNLGDSAALYNIRNFFSEKEYEWKSINIMDFIQIRNSEEKTKKIFRDKLKDCDCLIVGGGGLIEGGVYNSFYTKWKLPFNKTILETIEIPIYVVAVGLNNFRGKKSLSDGAVQSLKYLIDKSKIFSVRNDGTLDLIRKYVKNEKILEVPDPGLVFEYSLEKRSKTDLACFQPAFNLDREIMKNRFVTKDNFDLLMKFVKDKDFKIFPHTPKDYHGFSQDRMFFDKNYFLQNCKENKYNLLLKQYEKFDYSIAMRGHGQMIAIALNLPSLYLSTQDKVIDFSKKNGMLDFTIDIKEENWLEKLKNLNDKMKSDNSYVKKWQDIRDVIVKKSKTDFKNLMEKIKSDLRQ